MINFRPELSFAVVMLILHIGSQELRVSKQSVSRTGPLHFVDEKLQRFRRTRSANKSADITASGNGVMSSQKCFKSNSP